ncbi:UNVERIFIED_CONTAM: hypothetical protein Sangu_1715800 [Sesamum angustifolium]|uniref:Ty3-gypsy retrotransposon protein n=1 Tax=Sesamum angustifolium TaxID=2727405 RepID=A0AAW2MMJ4_9LAMI
MDTQGKAMKSVNSKLTISKSSSSSTKSVGVTTRSMSKKLKESSQMSPLADYSFTTNVAPVMVTNATTIEGQLANLTRAIEGLTKHVQEQDAQIARLINKADNVDANGLIPTDQLKEFIEGTIRSKIEGSSKSSLTYSKSYTPRIDSLKMPMGYQPSKFQQFDGMGNPKQHVAHFFETCNNAGTYGDHLVKQFVRSLMIELTNSRKWKEELVIDYINRWRNLSLNCKDRLSEASAIEMYIQGCIGDFAISSKESCPDPLKNWPLEHMTWS